MWHDCAVCVNLTVNEFCVVGGVITDQNKGYKIVACWNLIGVPTVSHRLDTHVVSFFWSKMLHFLEPHR